MTIKNVTPNLVYFAYGSNLLKERLHRSVNASREGIGKLKNFRLDFDHFSKRWGGSVATIVPHPGNEVWVAVWRIPKDGFEQLDKQEGVKENLYKRINVTVELPDGCLVNGYSYTLTSNPENVVPLDQLPKDRQPSKAYMNVILKGAEESGLPSHYKKQIMSILHNDYNGQIRYEIL